MRLPRLAALWLVLSATLASAQPVKNRISLLLDTSGDMLLSVPVVAQPETCATVGWNGCTGSGNPTAAQESCNACMAWTVRQSPSCATNFTAACRTTYQNCWRFFSGGTTGCGQQLNLVGALPTRGDGTALAPGCDVDGDGLANDSRIFAAKQATQELLATYGELELSLWGFSQVQGGQTCVADTDCPTTPALQRYLVCRNISGVNRCVLDAASLGSVSGQCAPLTWNGADGAFSCATCSDTGSERLVCEAQGVGQIRTGATSPLNGTVNCALPLVTHPYLPAHGAIPFNNVCDPGGAQRLVDFPATGFDDNYTAIRSFIDGQQANLGTDVELHPHGATPIASALRSMRAAALAAAAGDTHTPCRKHSVVLVVGGGENCESVSAAVTAAATFQNLSFTNAAGVVVPDYDVPVYVVALAVCPPSSPNCQARTDLSAIAAAGGTGSAIAVSNELELREALLQIASGSITVERCNGVDDDCDGVTDEGYEGSGSACAVGVGRCRSVGTVGCTGDELGTECSATAGAGVRETCNGLDDDCDGLVDNGIACGGCTPVCSGNCDVCNGRDDDCDGLFDEDFAAAACALLACSGTTSCQGTQGVQCSATRAIETCNDADDDCDGRRDGFSVVCYPGDAGCDLDAGRCAGACRFGVAACTAGAFGACAGAVVPRPEVGCNLVDEDCDGVVSLATDAGEQCNGLDDDCDGLIDENVALSDPDVGVPCDGGCRAGVVTCAAGREVCSGGQAAGVERCDGIDDDCDGVPDNAAVCRGVGQACLLGRCAEPCGTGPFPCAGGFACLGADAGSAGHCVPDLCIGVTCAAGEACDSPSGVCRPLCSGVMCRAGEQCRSGFCLDCFTLPLCTAGQACERDVAGVGQCVALGGADAGQPDAGAADAGPLPLPGVDGGLGPEVPAPGCGCNASPGFAAGLLLLMRVLRRRKAVLLALTLAACPGPAVVPDAGAGGGSAGGMAAGGGGGGGGGGTGTGGGTALDAGPTCVPEPEVCNGLDDDCDGQVDETFDLMADPDHCGTCERRCTYPNAFGRCTSGSCVQTGCQPGWADVDAGPGCEAQCADDGAERCDGRDNDCNGQVDEADPLLGQGCGPDAGVCAANAWACSQGALSCAGTAPAAERCDGLDNDCDGVVDQGFDKQNDPRFCGDACVQCALAHATPACLGGLCRIASCTGGFVDLNGLPDDGCEEVCVPRGPEQCNGVDDDCDGLVDQADPSLFVPANFCRQAGECVGTAPSCAGQGGWTCVYTDPDVEQTPLGDVAAEETRCDGKDNDCDGAADEVFPQKNGACGEDGTFGTVRRLGLCRGTGALTCNAAQTALRCNVTTAGAAPTAETCNNRDDDCDGHVDEPYDSSGFNGVRDVTVGPVSVNGQSVVMYRYEASRPDSTAASAGFVETRACSASARLPWANGDFFEARSACLAAGMRLCRVTRNGSGQVVSDEWGRFCEGASNRTWPYSNTFNTVACNGAEYDPVPGGVNEDLAILTGALATCESQELARDQSGNLKEWVDDPRTVGGQTVHTLRGGAFDNFEQGLTCDFDLTVVPPSYTFAHTGFRCCALSCTAGQSECSGACVNLATSNVNCGACGVACGGGTACSNGYCCPTGTRACGDVCVANATACP